VVDTECRQLHLGKLGMINPGPPVEFCSIHSSPKMPNFTCIFIFNFTGMAALITSHLHSSGGRLLVFNRTQSKIHEFVAAHPGSQAASHPKELAANCHLTFSCLANDDALKATFHDFLLERSSDGPPCVYIDSSTVLPATTRYLAALAAEHGVTYCHCPVFGRPDAAAAGKLMAYVAGGSPEVRHQVSGLVGVTFAQNGVHDLGSDPSSASAMKLVGNSYIAGQIELASECLALGEKAHLQSTAVLGLIQYITGNAPIPSGYARRIATGDYAAGNGFTVDLGVKDVSHVQSFAREVACPMPVADLAMNHLLSAKARYGGHLDWGAIGLAVREAAGLSSNAKQQ
jgi:3-hydroxyisobutyrate dehydrogenase-like beta-hydroxyacid dehydrogenase